VERDWDCDNVRELRSTTDWLSLIKFEPQQPSPKMPPAAHELSQIPLLRQAQGRLSRK
jgi:hypothetical protein